MKKFNPDKELRKVQYGTKNKMILGVFLLLLMISIGSTYALYQVRSTDDLVYTVVAPFSNKDITLAVYVDEAPVDKFPEKGSNNIFEKIECDNGSSGAFNTNTWQLILAANGPDKCNVYFKHSDNYIDGSGANPPELYQGLIPVTIEDDGTVKIANLTDTWYDYDAKRWANAVLVNASDTTIKNKYFQEDGSLKTDVFDTEIPMNEILQMYVWIPRFKYQLWHVEKSGGTDPQEIQIQFESDTLTTGEVSCTIASNGAETCTNAENGKWFTHPAFTFGDTELKGFWVGKFETSGNNTSLKVIPNVTPLLNVNVSYMFNASRSIEETYSVNFNINKEEIDTRQMKNMEWGAMAYLTHSKYGRCTDSVCVEVSRNVTEYKTGYAGASETWNTPNGMKASTTGNVYGVYDTNGGAWEYVMGNMVNASGAYYASSSGLASIPDEKYYDKYEYDASSYTTHQRGHLGDATRETLKTFGNGTGAWYGDYAYLPYATDSWFGRGGRAGGAAAAGTFAFYHYTGVASSHRSFRLVLSRA